MNEFLTKTLIPAPLIAGAVCVTMHLTNASKGGLALDGSQLNNRPDLQEEELKLMSFPLPQPPETEGSDNEKSDGNGSSEDDNKNSDTEHKSDLKPAPPSKIESTSSSIAVSNSSNSDPTLVVKYYMELIRSKSGDWIRTIGIESSHSAFNTINKLHEGLRAMSEANKEGAASGAGVGSGDSVGDTE